ncbi:hypothetical protein [Pseudorhodoferax soli]|uniref:Uncharacterized protein n=1 Tax=Pseudorhodoferax soli TaxID=545864 RepID=A0A368XTZ2_9BURK|nr:hypothetical protein [Pseudorhodoferax soli]RCW70508.1 hypothetical protein DES41_105451 [Pseudorhodoferax soli]
MAEALYATALKHMSATVHELANLVPQPQTVPFADSFAYRYLEKTPRQAVVQKLARYVTTLRAAVILFNQGFVQEQAALQRMLDEIQEDITFLAFGLIFGELTPIHENYLAAFYQEEFDPVTGNPGDQDRPMPPRKKIRAYIARMEGAALDPSRGVEVTRQVSKTYSGYVHAASPQIMDMYGGSPPRFYVDGMRGTPRHDEHREDLWNYFYRGILAFCFSAKAFGADVLFERISSFADSFAKQAGHHYGR